MWDDEIKLVARPYTKNSIGAQVPGTPVRTTILGTVKSVGRNEFYAAATNDMKPEIVITIHPYEYDGQREVEYDSNTYKVLRTYKPNFEELELTAEKVIGNVVL